MMPFKEKTGQHDVYPVSMEEIQPALVFDLNDAADRFIKITRQMRQVPRQ